MTDLPDAGAGWVEVDEHLGEARDHIDLAQGAVPYDHTDREQATTDRDQATTDREQATTDRDQATTDREQATTDRDQATTDRNESRARGRTSRDDVAALAGSVTELAKSVAGLHTLIRLSIEKADQAQAAATANPTRRRLNLTVIALIAFALVLAGIGGWVVHNQQQQAYQACQVRNMQQAQQQQFAGKLDAAVQRARREGSVLGRDLGSLLTPMPQAPTVMCHPPRP